MGPNPLNKCTILAFLVLISISAMAHADYPVSIFSLFHANNAEFYPSVTVGGQPISQYAVANAFYFNQTANVNKGATPVYIKSTIYNPQTLSVSSGAYWNLDSWFNTSGGSGSFGYLVPDAQITAGQPVTITYTDLAGGGNSYPSPYSTYVTLGIEVANGQAFLLPAPYTINWYSSTTPPTISASFSESDTSIVPSYDVDTQFASGICEAQTGGTLLGSTTMSATALPNNPGDYGWTGSITLTAPSTPTYYYGVISFGSVAKSLSATVIGGLVGSNLELCTLPILLAPATPSLDTPALASNPALPALLNPGNTITFTASNIGGGTAPYTLTYTISNTVTRAVIASRQYTGITATSNSFTWTIPQSAAGNTIGVNVTVTDSSGPKQSAKSAYLQTLYVAATANVLIVTTGIGDQTPSTAIQAYENVLQAEGLSSTYVELDSSQYTSLTGLSPVQAGSSWQTYKVAINNLEYATKASYLVILGDAVVIPMPTTAVSDPVNLAFETNKTDGLGLDPSAAAIPTDDPYGNLSPSGTIPSIAVARMVGESPADMAKDLNDAVNARSSGNTRLGVFTDTSPYPGRQTTMLEVTNTFMEEAFGSATNCAASGICYTSPSTCTLSAGQYTCSYATLESEMQSYGVQYYGCHGNGWFCAGSSTSYPVLVLSILIPNLPQKPVILMTGCLDSEIPGTYLYPYLQAYWSKAPGVGGFTGNGNTESLAQEFFASGASAYIGSTILYNTKTDLYLSEIYYNTFVFPPPSGITLGQAFLGDKINMEKSADPAIRDQGYGLQLYGDPTLAIGSLG